MIDVRSLGIAALAAGMIAAPALAQDAGHGGAVFAQQCAMCHVNVAGKPATIGPNLAGLVGRKAASTSFSYTPALKGSKLTWDKATLDKFLTAPGKMVPGTAMMIAVPDPKTRADLIAFLATKK